jgi:hypothetical protein
MDPRYSRETRSAFDETHDGAWRWAAREATRNMLQEKRHGLGDVQLLVERLAAFGVPPSFQAATANLVIFALAQPVVGLHPGVSTVHGILLSRPSAEKFKVQMP